MEQRLCFSQSDGYEHQLLLCLQEPFCSHAIPVPGSWLFHMPHLLLGEVSGTPEMLMAPFGEVLLDAKSCSWPDRWDAPSSNLCCVKSVPSCPHHPQSRKKPGIPTQPFGKGNLIPSLLPAYSKLLFDDSQLLPDNSVLRFPPSLS